MVATGAGATVISTFGTSLLSGQTDEEAAKLRGDTKEGVLWLGNNVSQQPDSVKEWLANSEVIKASKKEFDQPVHAEWANDTALRGTKQNFLKTAAGFFGKAMHFAQMGVTFHPWMTVLDDYSPNVTLNNVEIASLLPTAKYFMKQPFYNKGSMVLAPFPDTPRLPVNQLSLDGFAKLVLNARFNPDDFKLHYVRYYVMSVATKKGQAPKTQTLVAHGYTRAGEQASLRNLRLDFVGVDA
jgi:hypothetical protein